MAAMAQPSRYYVVFLTTSYRSLAEAQVDAGELIAAHVARSKELHKGGTLLMAGAFLDRPEEPPSTMAVLTSREACEEVLKGDPLVQNGKGASWAIREGANPFA